VEHGVQIMMMMLMRVEKVKKNEIRDCKKVGKE
jgi:hypothetical protein